MKTIIAIIAIVAASVAPACAQLSPGPLKLTAHELKPGVYWVVGGTSNTGFVVGDKGVVVIDAQRSVEATKMKLAEIAKITSKPVDAVVLTHGDPDHVAGLPGFPAGTPTLMHENTWSQIVASAADPNAPPMWGPVYKSLANLPPTKTVGATESVVLGGTRMVLMYVAPAHSAGDLIVYLPEQKVVFAGDVITTNTGPMPIIHHHSGGTSLGWIATMKAMLALDAEVYVPGHGAIASREKLQGWVREVEERRAQIKAMVAAKKTLDEIKKALPEPGQSPRFPVFAETTYDELTKGYPPAGPPWLNMVRPAPGAAQAPGAPH